MDICPAFSPLPTYAPPTHLLGPGNIIKVKRATVHTGGSIGNTGLALKLLGNEVQLIGKIGSDAFGRIVQNDLQHAEAADHLIIDKSSSTAYSIFISVPGTAPFILHNAGANEGFLNIDVTDSALLEAELFHFGYPPIMRGMYQDDGIELATLFRRAKTFGCITSLDFSSLDPDSDGGLVDWPTILKGVLPYVDFFIPRFVDLCWVLNRERYNALLGDGAPSGIVDHVVLRRDAAPLAQWALEQGCGAVLVKSGATGLYLRTSCQGRVARFCDGHGLNARLWANREIVQPSFKADTFLSDTGAGEVCVAAFLTALLNGERPDACVSLAAAEGASCVSSSEVLGGLLTIPQLKRLILAGWERNPSPEG
ncbi:MAG: carbohydrate kinase family protein [Clostridiales bacterium]|nr:carbohydrate kinase family protein [Clostridiales bacterium]